MPDPDDAVALAPSRPYVILHASGHEPANEKTEAPEALPDGQTSVALQVAPSAALAVLAKGCERLAQDLALLQNAHSELAGRVRSLEARAPAEAPPPAPPPAEPAAPAADDAGAATAAATSAKGAGAEK